MLHLPLSQTPENAFTGMKNFRPPEICFLEQKINAYEDIR